MVSALLQIRLQITLPHGWHKCSIGIRKLSCGKELNMVTEKTFPNRKVSDERELLNIIQSTNRYIDRFIRKSKDGIYWSDGKEEVLNLSRYHGDAGVLEYYLELAEYIDRDKYYDIAAEGARYLALHWRDLLLPASIRLIQQQDPLPCVGKGVHFGVAGIAATLTYAWYVLYDERKVVIENALKDIVDWYSLNACTGSFGSYWTGNTTQLFDGGIIEVLIDIKKLFQDRKLDSLIQSAGRELLSRGVEQNDGSLDFDGFGQMRQFNYWRDRYYEELTGVPESGGFTTTRAINGYRNSIHSHRPNFAYGSAGAGVVLIRLYDETGDEAYLDAAERAAQFVVGLRVHVGKGYLSPHDLNTGPDLFYAGECNGVSGTSKLLYALYRRTGNRQYMQYLEEYVDGLDSIGVPEQQSPGLWYNASLCCGHAGLLRFFVGLYVDSGNVRWLDLARRTVDVINGMSRREMGEHGEEISWPIAWSRLEPNAIDYPIGYQDGASGIASSLLEFSLLLRGEYRWHRSYDDPFPTACLF